MAAEGLGHNTWYNPVEVSVMSQRAACFSRAFLENLASRRKDQDVKDQVSFISGGVR